MACNSDVILDGAQAAFKEFMNAPQRAIEAAISRWYNLLNVPTEGRAYLMRSVVMSRPGDIMRIDPTYKAQARQLFTHLARTGTSVMNWSDIVWSAEYGACLNKGGGRIPDFFLYDNEANDACPDQVRYEITWALENKVAFAEEWGGHEGPMPLTAVVRGETGDETDGYEMPTASRVWNIIGCAPGRLKAGLGASGDEVATFISCTELEELMASTAWRNRDYVVQRDVGHTDVSVSYYATDKGVYLLFTTRQANTGAAQEGNFLDMTLQQVCCKVADPIALEAWSRGFRGFYAFDVRLDTITGKAWVIECNARPTAPTYGWILMMKHKAPWFCVMNLKDVPETSVARVVGGHLEYRPGKDAGVIVHNAGPLCLDEGRSCSVTVLAPDETKGLALLRQLREHSGARMADLPGEVLAEAA